MPNPSPGSPPVRLIPGWKVKLGKLWSLRVAMFGIVFWSALSGLWVLWPAFVERLPLWF